MLRSNPALAVLLGLLAVPLVVVGGTPPAGAAHRLPAVVRPADLVPDTEDAAVGALRNPALTAAQKERAIERLGRFDRSPLAVAELIRWLDFVPMKPGVFYSSSHVLYYRPAADALKRVGPFAVPQLVADYIQWSDAPPTSEKASHQLQLLLIFNAGREMAVAVVADAARRLRDNPDDRTRRACRELIDDTSRKYWRGEWPELFPDLVPNG